MIWNLRIITEEQAYSNLKVVFKQESAHGKALGIFICTSMTSVSLWQFLQRPCDHMTPSVMVMVKIRVFSGCFCHVCQQQKNMTHNKSIHFNWLQLFSSLTWLEDGGNCMALLWWLLTYAICWMRPSCTSFHFKKQIMTLMLIRYWKWLGPPEEYEHMTAELSLSISHAHTHV